MGVRAVPQIRVKNQGSILGTFLKNLQMSLAICFGATIKTATPRRFSISVA